MAAPQIVTVMYDFLLYLIPQVAKFPKGQRYLLGERLESVSFDTLELLLEAVYTRDKSKRSGKRRDHFISCGPSGWLSVGLRRDVFRQ